MAEEQKLTSEFSVYWWDPEGTYHKEREFMPAKEAMELAHSLTTRPAAQLGIIRKVMITDGGDCCVFEWRKDEGVVWPTKEEIAAAGLRTGES